MFQKNVSVAAGWTGCCWCHSSEKRKTSGVCWPVAHWVNHDDFLHHLPLHAYVSKVVAVFSLGSSPTFRCAFTVKYIIMFSHVLKD